MTSREKDLKNAVIPSVIQVDPKDNHARYPGALYQLYLLAQNGNVVGQMMQLLFTEKLRELKMRAD